MGPYSEYVSGKTLCPSSLPSSASNITVEPITSNIIHIEWNISTQYCGPIRNFIVSVMPLGSNTTLCNVITHQNFANCIGVQSAQSYSVSVTTNITCSNDVTAISNPSIIDYVHPCYISDAPNNVAFTTTNDGVMLNWDSVTNCGNVMYNIYWSCGNYEQNASTNVISYKINIAGIMSFSYCLAQVQACNEQGCSRFSDSITVQTSLQPPPTASITGAVNGTTVHINFIISQPTDLNDLNYTLYRRKTSPSNTSFIKIFDNVPYNFSNVLTDTDPGEQETYDYQLQLLNSMGIGPLSNMLSVITTMV